MKTTFLLDRHSRSKLSRARAARRIVIILAPVALVWLIGADRIALPFFRIRISVEAEREVESAQLGRSESLQMLVRGLGDEFNTFGRFFEHGTGTPVAILSRAPQSPYGTLIVDGGSDLGIGIGDKVYFGEIIVGEVIETTPRSAKVGLISKEGERHDVVIMGPNLSVAAEGDGNGTLRIDLPKGIQIPDGSSVRLTGSPIALVGRILRSEIDRTDPFQHFFVQPPININEVQWLIIRK